MRFRTDSEAVSGRLVPADLTPAEFPQSGGLTVGEIAAGRRALAGAVYSNRTGGGAGGAGGLHHELLS